MKGEKKMEMEKDRKIHPHSKLKFLLKKKIYVFYTLFLFPQKQNFGVKRV